ncbi:hypothetical protein COCCU_11640 [Corynebacterium occultum]|uniref:Carboxymuconolactone decarboxylase-like domain-containing protein n=1 Tax=Corynebacterium occultum TaxID=2675219 RepID=A0A6B8VYX9_9CORY|nr:carboxymuconolactone decarboxylase family protein [Corynebacterium occultum]QGU08229.1 hypothetical protein COCCU_11640 [Corynebacterium occultum]
MARIDYFDPESAPEHIIRAMGGKKKLGIFRMIANSENVGPEVLELGKKLSVGSSLPHEIREVVILRVGYLSDAAYELKQHTAVARRVGLSDEMIAAIGEYPDSCFPFTQEHLDYLHFTDAVVKETTPGDEVFSRVQVRLDNSQLVELVLLIGFYMMVSRVMNTFNIDLETGPAEPYSLRLQ